MTEHYPAPSVQHVSDVDKLDGHDTRIYDNSVVYLDQAPFNIKNVLTIFEDDAGSCFVNRGENANNAFRGLYERR